MERITLPHRRTSRLVAMEHGGSRFTLSISPPIGDPLEVFADPEKYGSEMSHILADACVVISLALQHGVKPDDLAKSLGRIPSPIDRAASVIGAIVAELQV